MEKDVAHRVCELIAGLLAADGELHPAESDFLRRTLVALRRDIEPVDELHPPLEGPQAAAALQDLPEEVRQEAFELLVAAAVVDGKVVPAEQRFLESVAAGLGVGADQLQARIAEQLMDG